MNCRQELRASSRELEGGINLDYILTRTWRGDFIKRMCKVTNDGACDGIEFDNCKSVTAYGLQIHDQYTSKKRNWGCQRKIGEGKVAKSDGMRLGGVLERGTASIFPTR